MDDLTKQPPNGMRKTTAAAFATLTLFASLPQLKAMKDYFLGDQIVTNERIETTLKESFARLENKIEKHLEDDVVTHRRMHDLWTADVVSLGARCEKQTDKIELRVSNLEIYAFKGFGHSRSNN